MSAMHAGVMNTSTKMMYAPHVTLTLQAHGEREERERLQMSSEYQYLRAPVISAFSTPWTREDSSHFIQLSVS